MSNERHGGRRPRVFNLPDDAERENTPSPEEAPVAETIHEPSSEELETASGPETTEIPVDEEQSAQEKPDKNGERGRNRDPRAFNVREDRQGSNKDEEDIPLHTPRERARSQDGYADPEAEESSIFSTSDDTDGVTLPTLKGVRKGFRWTALLLSSFAALATLSIGMWLHTYVLELVARNDWIGWLALGITAIIAFAFLMILLRELFALARLGRIGRVRDHAISALNHDDRKAAERIQSNLTGLYASRRTLKWGLANVRDHRGEVMSTHDRLVLLERNLMAPLDSDAYKIVAESARRVSVMTAVSPFVFLDMIMVAAENFRMIRRLMTLYGGRPGTFSQFKMIGMMISNLAMSGGIAVGADLISHVMGRQFATRLAGRLGEGVVNGTLTARLGMTATRLIRPLPYIESKPVSIRTFVKEISRNVMGRNKD